MKDNRMSFRASLSAFALAALLSPAALWAQDTAATTETSEAEQTEDRAANAGEDIVLGAEDAPLTIIEYASFTCNHCGAFHQNVFPDLKAEYIDTGKVRFIQRDVYFDAVSLWAGILARCEPERFYTVGGMILDEQDKWLRSNATAEELANDLRKIGLRAGMDQDVIQACWDDREFAETLAATYQENATADKVEATPTFIIGDEKVPNQAWDSMKKIIDAKLNAADGASK